ncbi:hypothetical protein [Floricoccus penangensis]|uniref:hypothetical protein n=1 Tax=Floricoccus penangensis TaxID=1859475 RepID=UPI00203CE5F4|nr:hypothetical protein [Floricoccus penangensis]URZ86884.1 hypothetical protein KIW23_07280 [Floricoccus penangensis]
MKKSFIISASILSLLALSACSGNKENTSTSKTTNSKVETKKEDKSSNSAIKESTTSSSTLSSEDKAKQEEQGKIDSFNALSDNLKYLMIGTTVDERIKSGLDGLTLYYTPEGEFTYIYATSNMGVGHPFYKLKVDNNSVIPVDGVVRESSNTYANAPVDATPVSKAKLYDEYIANKSLYDGAATRVEKSQNTESASESFDRQKSYVNNSKYKDMTMEEALNKGDADAVARIKSLDGTWKPSDGGANMIIKLSQDGNNLSASIEGQMVGSWMINASSAVNDGLNVILTNAGQGITDVFFNTKFIFKDDNTMEMFDVENFNYNSNKWVDDTTFYSRVN